MSEIEKVTPAQGNAGAVAITKVASSQPLQHERLDSQGSQVDQLPMPGSSIDFLQRYSPEGPWLLVAIPPDNPRGIEAASFMPAGAGADAAARWIAARNGKTNLYFHLNSPAGGLTKKADKSQILYGNVLHVDIDPEPGKPVEEERQRILALLTASRPSAIPEPSAIIDSGGGYWGIWFLDKPVHTGGVESHNANFERYSRALESAFGADNCHNIDRIARLPFTANLPNEKKRAQGRAATSTKLVAFDERRRYALDSFIAAQPVARQDSAKSALSVGEAKVPDLDALGLSEETCALIVDGEAGQYGGDRSRAALRVVGDLVRASALPEIILGVLTNPAWKISAHALKTKNARRTVLRMIEAVQRGGEDFPDGYDRGGRPVASYVNAITALQLLGLDCTHDVFRDRKFVQGHAVGEHAGEIGDASVRALRRAIREQFRFDPNKENLTQAVLALCEENRFDPVCDYLDGLKWDGQPRLDRMLVEHLGADDNTLNRAISRKLILAMVTRARRPGCKFDTMVVLEGPQGLGKSTFCSDLAGTPDLHIDTEVFSKDDRGAQELMQGRWVIEVGELAGMKRADIERVKAHLSRTHERARPAYGNFLKDQPRRCVLIGTTNPKEYLRDLTGNRRYWPVEVREYSRETFLRDRDQIFAEACAAFDANESLVLDRELWADAAVRQNSRLAQDRLAEIIDDLNSDTLIDVIENGQRTQRPALTQVPGEERIHSGTLFDFVLRLSPGQASDTTMKRVRHLMERAGFEHTRALRIGRRVAHGFRRRVELPLTDDESSGEVGQ